MRVPGFGRSSNSFNTFIIIALLNHWDDRGKNTQSVMREAIGKIVTNPQAIAFPISPQSIRVSNYKSIKGITRSSKTRDSHNKSPVRTIFFL